MKTIIHVMKELKYFLVLWFGQSVSLLGSAMTGFALTIWSFEKTGSALVLSISALFIMVPKMIIGIFAGPLVDRLNKKKVMIFSDIGAGLCTLVLFVLLKGDRLEIWHIYALNAVNSVFGSFQMPASNVAISALVPKKYYVKTNGLQSFSEGAILMLAPVFAAALLGFTGITGVIVADFITMVLACLSLAFFVKIPVVEKNNSKFNTMSYFSDLSKGMKLIKASPLLLQLMLLMVFINFAAGLAYHGLLSPMILARTANNTNALAAVNGAIGLGSIAGGIVVLIVPTAKRKTRVMFLCLMLSFFFGDIFFALCQTTFSWTVAGFLTSVFLPVYMANSDFFWRTIIPIEQQGCVFSLKFALQGGAVPIGTLVGGFMADYVLEPFMKKPPIFLLNMLGSGNGAGMALMFLFTGISGIAISLFGLLSRSMRMYETQYYEQMQ